MTAVTIERRRITVRGVVQGVGFRPFVARTARDLGLVGHCGNDDSGVFVEAEGPSAQLDELQRRLRDDAPPLARVASVAGAPVPVVGERAFTIVESRSRAGLRTLVPADTATCDACLAELLDATDRRHRHPFITCTDCGPRFTIICDLPYDRPATTMAAFPMCAACRAEYDDPADRRYHAQPVACHDCGPRLWAQAGDEVVAGTDAALVRAQQVLAAGGIVAIKGIGGFHLACDATNAAAVEQLRARKARPHKPFALMAPSLAAARELVDLDEPAIASLTGPARPIVLAAALPQAPVAAAVAPGLDELGVMLPYAPLHTLLFTAVPGADIEPPALLVMTSGNLSNEPLCFENDDARARLAPIADIFLLHDRDIAVPCEDSVVTIVDRQEAPVRRSRGYAPLPVWLPSDAPSVLAVGGEIKNAFCVTRGELAFLSAHLGDMGTLESRQAFDRSVSQLLALHDVQPVAIVADAHPGYVTHAWADARGEATGLPVLTVQHHHAHFASLLAEHGRLGTAAVGVILDGTGYGCDQTVWGGEILLVGPGVDGAERVGHLEPFELVGGDAAVRNPFRSAMSLLHLAGIGEVGLDLATAVPDSERDAVRHMLQTGTGCVRTTSAGRVFDAVASLLGVRHRISYEGQAAVELEALARRADRPVPLGAASNGGEVRLSELVTAIVSALRAGHDRAGIAWGFHLALARSLAHVAATIAHRRSIGTIGLSGGVFANRILTAELRRILLAEGFEVLTHRVVPANDGGLALGQAAVARDLIDKRGL